MEANRKAGAVMEEKKKKRVRFEIDRTGCFAEAAMILLLLSAIFRLIGSWGQWGDEFFTATQIILPVCACVLFLLCIYFFGKKGFWLSSIPVLLGVTFFIIKSLAFESLIHTILCIVLYIAVAVIYCGTIFGVIKTKWLLPPLFGLPFLYHVLVEDLAAMRDTANPVTFTDGMMEMSVLCVMAALFCIGLGLKKKKPEPERELPKIKDPVIFAPKTAKKAEEPAEGKANAAAVEAQAQDTAERKGTAFAEKEPEPVAK